MLKDAFIGARRFLTRRRGDCFGAMLAGYTFIVLAPKAEVPDAFRLIGIPLLIAGAIVSAIVVAFPFNEENSSETKRN